MFVTVAKKKMKGARGAEEDQLAFTECDRVSEKRAQNGKVQNDQVAAAATPHCELTTGQSY